MSKNLYALSLTFWVAVGIAFSAGISLISRDWTFSNGWILLLFALGVLAVAVLGTLIYNASSNPVISLFGYGLVAGPFGLLLGPVVAMYTPESVLKIFVITSAMVLILGIVGAVIPDSLESWGKWLFGGLLILLLGYFIVPLAGFFGADIGGAMTILDWIGVVLFSILVIYDLNRAMRLPRTLDNSIDAAAAVFVDFINIFIRLLALLGETDD